MDPTRPKKRAPGVTDTFSEFTKSGKEPMSELNKRNGTNVPVPK
jgi:hypothetical protein